MAILGSQSFNAFAISSKEDSGLIFKAYCVSSVISNGWDISFLICCSKFVCCRLNLLISSSNCSFFVFRDLISEISFFLLANDANTSSFWISCPQTGHVVGVDSSACIIWVASSSNLSNEINRTSKLLAICLSSEDFACNWDKIPERCANRFCN